LTPASPARADGHFSRIFQHHNRPQASRTQLAGTADDDDDEALGVETSAALPALPETVLILDKAEAAWPLTGSNAASAAVRHTAKVRLRT